MHVRFSGGEKSNKDISRHVIYQVLNTGGEQKLWKDKEMFYFQRCLPQSPSHPSNAWALGGAGQGTVLDAVDGDASKWMVMKNLDGVPPSS